MHQQLPVLRQGNPVLCALAVALAATSTLGQQAAQPTSPSWGHSSHGAAYDTGPRQRPWKMDGIGSTTIPITTSVPEVQEWFDQGLSLMHGFWHFEAERAFRWCLKLDPECAMAYWGLALAIPPMAERENDFLARASDLAQGATPRERAFIAVAQAVEAVPTTFGFDGPKVEEGKAGEEALDAAMIVLDCLLMDYPDDVEAKALYWLLAYRLLGEDAERMRYGLETVLGDILDADPDHVGALHYRIHNWDGKEGRYAIDSCLRLSEIAPNCGHLQHMPGHVLSGIGMWHEAAIAMDRATRVEKAYMHERMIVPEDNWDYVHNLDYLGYIQEQLGMPDEALAGVEQMRKGPGFAEMPFFQVIMIQAQLRALIKFERWETLLQPGVVAWDEEAAAQKVLRSYAECRAHLGLGRIEEAQAELETFKDLVGEAPGSEGDSSPDQPDFDIVLGAMKSEFKSRVSELEALLLLAQGQALEGLTQLASAAKEQAEDWSNDPPREPSYIYNILGDQYLELGAPSLAAECFERTLEAVLHDGFALAGSVVAYSEMGAQDKARSAMAKLQVVWSDAQPNRWLAAAAATGIEARPLLDAPVTQRNYKREVLDVEGPSLWTRPLAPKLSARDAEGELVTLERFKGQNVLILFYLGDECLHCMEQIAIAEERLEALSAMNTAVLGVSKDSVEEIAEQAEDFDIQLLSDPSFNSARRFHSFDDFEEIELHSTFLIDTEGRVHWSRIGGDPFTDFDFIEAELRSLNSGQVSLVSPEVGAPNSGQAASVGSK